MHEAGIANNIISIVNDSVNDADRLKVKEIRLRVGMLSNVNMDALVSAFELTVVDSDLANAKLFIETLPVVLECNDCKNVRSTDEFIFTCANCGSSNIEVKSGDELEISEILVDS
jgi:hydrogenase nickel insertion protein HypA